MPVDENAALVPFIDHLDQIESGMVFVSVASSAKRCVPAVVNWNVEATDALRCIRTFLDVASFPEQMYFNSVYLSSVAAFEEFLRQTLDRAIRSCCEKAKTFDDLSKDLQHRHMEATGHLLTLSHNPPHHLKIDFFGVCRRIGSCYPKSREFELNTEALCMLRDLTKLDSFFKLLQKCGYDITWDRMGKRKDLQKCLKTKKARDTNKELKRYLEDMVQKRNRIAHTGAASDITNPVLRDHLRLLQVTAEAITELVAAKE